jgi:hypothetical protein
MAGVIPAKAGVIPAKAGIQSTVTKPTADWIPACAGMTLFPPARE